MRDSEFRAMVGAEERHWWYRGRRHVLAAELDRLALAPEPSILDAGCGTGRNLDDLARRGSVSGADIHPAAVDMARSRGHDVQLAALEQLPWPAGHFDLVTCLDVLEHTDDDRAALAELWRVSRPGSHLVITVPAYPRLWSSHDVANEHRRRYRAETLRAVAEQSGWAWQRSTFFNSILLPAAALVRLAQGIHTPRPVPESQLYLTPPRLNGALESTLRIEARLLRRGARLPAGLSLLAVGRRAER
jgi:SAM-dependent methyltransferase